MKVIGIREIKDRLSEYIRFARRKGPVFISRHGEIVAELRTAYGASAPIELEPEFRDLVDRGLLRPGHPHDPIVYPVLPPAVPEGAAARLLAEDRGER